MKKLFNNLPFRLLLGIIIGVILGQVFPESVMKVVVTLQYIMGQLITFCVPLIIIGFIAPRPRAQRSGGSGRYLDQQQAHL